jgi:N-acyl-D-amino-acid deacylase
MCDFMQIDAEAGQPGYWEGTLISHCDPRPEYEGRNLQELAYERSQAPEDTTLDILLETHGEVDMVQFAMDEANVEMGLKVPYVMIGSDGEGRAVTGRMSSGKPHPRNYGTFPRVLGHYSRDRGLFSLETAVHKMTGLTAGRFGLRERGLLRAGNYADITIFDPQRVIDRATFGNPHQYAEGIEYVLVNGRPVLWQGEHTGTLAGQVLRR